MVVNESNTFDKQMGFIEQAKICFDAFVITCTISCTIKSIFEITSSCAGAKHLVNIASAAFVKLLILAVMLAKAGPVQFDLLNESLRICVIFSIETPTLCTWLSNSVSNGTNTPLIVLRASSLVFTSCGITSFTIEAAVAGKAETVDKRAFRAGWIADRAPCNDCISGPNEVFRRDLAIVLIEARILSTAFVMLVRALLRTFTRPPTIPPTIPPIPSKRPADP